MRYKSIRGMEDILPQEVQIWQKLESIARQEFESYGYKEIRTPILEDTSIFVRSIGETTDIVKKEMYSFEDMKGRSLTLRPEGTAPIVRAYIEHSLDKTSPESRLYYIGPMFRSERPQKGRLRQFHQIGAEFIGTISPQADFEIIMQLDRMLRRFQLEDFTIKLNTLGCEKDKNIFIKRLKDYLRDKRNMLCDDCKNRLDKNPLRILDCKKDSCLQILRNAPNMIGSLCPACVLHFATLKAMLQSIGIVFVEAKNLVRGLDYYTGTVFEITHSALGSQDAIGAGGRYDNLVKDLGGPSIGAVGYAIGIERTILAIGDNKKLLLKPECVYVVTLGDNARVEGIRIAERLRKELKLSVLMDIKEASLKSQMRSADKYNAKFVIILGEDELKTGKAAIRNMVSKEQVSVDINKVAEEIKKHIGETC